MGIEVPSLPLPLISDCFHYQESLKQKIAPLRSFLVLRQKKSTEYCVKPLLCIKLFDARVLSEPLKDSPTVFWEL